MKQHLDPTRVKESIREIRSNAGMSQTCFAVAVGLTRTQIADYETGRSMPRADTYLKILTFPYHNNGGEKTQK